MNPQQKYRAGLLNDFARRSFRDVADHDYVHARLAWKSQLFPQFQWSALQAIEKYLKAILLYNRIPATRLGHDLSKALTLTSQLPFVLDLSSTSRKFIEYLDWTGRFRYLESSYYIHGPKLVELDKTVWELRRYCRPLNYGLPRADGTVFNYLSAELNTIKAASQRPFYKFRIQGGRLEGIIDKTEHPSRSALVWNNMFFGGRNRRKIKLSMPSHAENAPLFLHPELLDEVLKYVHLPKDLAQAYRSELAKKQNVTKGK